MVNRNIWPLLGLVCAVHFFLLQAFLNADARTRSLAAKRTGLSLALIEPSQPTLVPSKKAESPKSQASPALAEQKALSNPATRQSPELTQPLQQSVESKVVGSAIDRSKFLDFDALDQSAIATDEFELTLNKLLPTKFDSIVLELLIDETGRTVQVACIAGDCLTATHDGLQQLLSVPFLPAVKDGQAVASRKVIEILPTLTLGL